MSLFFLFSGFLITFSLGTVYSRHLLVSIFSLVLTFFNAAALFLIERGEFLALFLIGVYGGVIAVLLFTVSMMFPPPIVNPSHSRSKGMISVMSIFATELVIIFSRWHHSTAIGDLATFPISSSASNTYTLGELIYTHYLYSFQISGLILFTTTIGIVLLVLPDSESVFRLKQRTRDQIRRKREDVLEIKKIGTRKGTLREGSSFPHSL